MLLKVLPKAHSHNTLFFRYKHNDEFLGLATLEKHQLHFDTVKELQADIQNFFTVGIVNEPIWEKIDYTKTSEFTKTYKLPIENFCKLVWLTRAYINNKGLRDPIGVHYDIDLDKWVIHPGGSRQKVIHLFHRNSVPVLAFNTGGKRIKFDKIFENFAQLQGYYQNPELHLVVVADHGTLIPHVHFSTGNTLINEVRKVYTRCKKFYSNYAIEANFDLEYYNYKTPSRSKKIYVELDDPTDIDMQVRAFALLPFFQEFNDYGVKIAST